MISIGIKIYAFLSLVSFALMVLFVIFKEPFDMFSIAYMITSIGWLVFGIGVLKRLEWSRIGLIVVAAIYIIDSVEYPSRILNAIKNRDFIGLTILGIGLAFFGSLIFYFTMPGIKQQFKKKQ
jgi:lysylphosphatidylglycerol synthetase-like protein (DUF2156 family)